MDRAELRERIAEYLTTHHIKDHGPYGNNLDGYMVQCACGWETPDLDLDQSERAIRLWAEHVLGLVGPELARLQTERDALARMTEERDHANGRARKHERQLELWGRLAVRRRERAAQAERERDELRAVRAEWLAERNRYRLLLTAIVETPCLDTCAHYAKAQRAAKVVLADTPTPRPEMGAGRVEGGG